MRAQAHIGAVRASSIREGFVKGAAAQINEAGTMTAAHLHRKLPSSSLGRRWRRGARRRRQCGDVGCSSQWRLQRDGTLCNVELIFFFHMKLTQLEDCCAHVGNSHSNACATKYNHLDSSCRLDFLFVPSLALLVGAKITLIFFTLSKGLLHTGNVASPKQRSENALLQCARPSFLSISPFFARK